MNVKDQTESEIIDAMYAAMKEGANCRDTLGGVNPHKAGTIEYFLHSQGWLLRDLQIALCRADPTYRKSQINSVSQELLDHA